MANGKIFHNFGKPIPYMPKRIYFETTEVITRNKKGYIEIDTDFTQVYHCFSEIAPLINSATSFKLMFWLLANEAGKYNGIRSNKIVYAAFNEYLIKTTKGGVTERTFHSCMDELVQAKALTKVTRGCYYFNPYIFWKDDVGERQSFITDEAKERRFLSHNPIDTPELD